MMQEVLKHGTVVKELDPDTGHPVPKNEWGLVVSALIDDTPEGKKLYYRVAWDSFREELVDADNLERR